MTTSTVTHIAQPSLKIDSQDASTELLEDILQLSVEESIHKPAMFTLVVNNPAFPGRNTDTTWKHADTFAIGMAIEIGFAASITGSTEFSSTNQSSIFKGEITAIEAHFNSKSQAPIVIRGYDVSHRLHRGRFNRSFQDMTDSDIVNQIIGEVGITAGTVSSTNSVHKYVFQRNQTNMEFLRERAARNGFELFIQDGQLFFRAPSQGDTVDLKWLTNLQSFRVRVSSAEQVSSVEVRGWDYTQKQAIVSTKTSAQVITSNEFGSGSDTSSSFQGQPSSPKVTIVDQPVVDTTEADKIAQSLLDELAGEFITADAEAEGNPQIRPGRVVNLSEMGKYSGSYYVTETRHLYAQRVYTTEFSIRGLRGGDLLAVLAPPTRIQSGQAVMIGIVSNNKDPDGLGRVRVTFPTLTTEHESNWARVASVGAGISRGLECLPEVNDEVLVAFEHGDIHRPYVIGGLWNGTDTIPETVENAVVDSGVRLRTFKTRVGHVLQFVEEDKDSVKKGIELKTADSHSLSFNDTDKLVKLTTEGGFTVTLDENNKKIEILTSGGHTLSLDDQGKKLNVTSSGGNTVSLDDNMPGKIEITSTGDININAGSMNAIKLNANTIELSANTSIKLGVSANAMEVSMTEVKMEGIQANVNGTAQAKVSGPLVNVEASGIMTIQGSLTKIN